MGRQHTLVYALNAGGVDPEAITRVDLEKMRLAGEHPVRNLMPRVLGPSTLRPGTEHLLTLPSASYMYRFWKDNGAGYVLLFSPGEMRIISDGALQQTVSVATTIATGSWTDESIGSASATGGATLTLNANTRDTAILRQSVSVASGDQAKAHSLRVVVSRGPVFVKIGTSAGSSDLLPQSNAAELATGTHVLSVTPNAASIWIDVMSYDPVTRIVSGITVDAAGVLVIPTPWDTLEKIKSLRMYNSLDVLFVGDGVSQQRRIEHRGPTSWGVSLYQGAAGPMTPGSNRVGLTPASASGNTTVTATEGVFLPGHVGALLEMTHIGKIVTDTLAGVDEASDYITITGITTGRDFYITATPASFVGTLALERSFDPGDPVSWVVDETFVDGAASFTHAYRHDSQDNIKAHYRFRISAHTSGSVGIVIEYAGDVKIGRSKITGYTSPTQVGIEVLETFGRAATSRQWQIGAWSDASGWPRMPVIVDGRLHWFRADMDYASVPDDYHNFDRDIEGDSAPLARSTGSGGDSGVLWALDMERLVVGTSRSEAAIAASEFDAPLTQTAYTVRRFSRRGSADIAAVEHGDGLFFVGRDRRRLYETSMGATGSRFETSDISRLNPSAYGPRVSRVAIQINPETRHYAALYDGTVAVLTYERRDEVAAITTIEFDGAFIDDVLVLPGVEQDDVYFIVNRGGVRSLERFAPEYDQTSAAACALLDSHKVLTGSVTAISGGTHLVGQTVQVWADGKRHPDVTIDGSGNAALSGGPYARVVYGKEYTASFKSVKLAYAAQLGDAVGQTKMVRGAGLVLVNSCLDGIMIGPDAGHLDPMPDIVDGAPRMPNQVFAHYDNDLMPINSEWTPDARFYVHVSSAEGPVTLQAVVLDVETRDGA